MAVDTGQLFFEVKPHPATSWVSPLATNCTLLDVYFMICIFINFVIPLLHAQRPTLNDSSHDRHRRRRHRHLNDSRVWAKNFFRHLIVMTSL
jgi:hypothetical protein